MECPNKEKNLKRCNCSYPVCDKKGLCCECLHYHLKMRQLPACCFPDDVEKTYDRSFETFAKLVLEKKI
ncbi:DUF6485 family protein [Methanocaldococcus indicus]|uniref:DUF6485 family protein n=1 Tax=Methanocaldococcus indicus TaxID=213231 RepID=UPI003C6D58E1